MVVIWRVFGETNSDANSTPSKKGRASNVHILKDPYLRMKFFDRPRRPLIIFRKKSDYCPYFAAWYSVVSAVISEQNIYPPKIIPFPTHPPPKFENTFIAAEKNLHAIAAFTKNKLHLIKVMKISPLCLVHGLKRPATNLSNCTYSGRFRQKKKSCTKMPNPRQSNIQTTPKSS